MASRRSRKTTLVAPRCPKSPAMTNESSSGFDCCKASNWLGKHFSPNTPFVDVRLQSTDSQSCVWADVDLAAKEYGPAGSKFRYSSGAPRQPVCQRRWLNQVLPVRGTVAITYVRAGASVRRGKS